jgi:hypothetical protein
LDSRRSTAKQRRQCRRPPKLTGMPPLLFGVSVGHLDGNSHGEGILGRSRWRRFLLEHRWSDCRCFFDQAGPFSYQIGTVA